MPNSSIRLGKWTLPLEHEHDSEETVNNWNIMKGDTAWVSYKEPTVKNLDGPFDDNAAVYHVNASTGYKGWNYMIIIGGNQDNPTNVKGGKLIPAAHPVSWSHLTFSSTRYSFFFNVDPPPRSRLRASPAVRI